MAMIRKTLVLAAVVLMQTTIVSTTPAQPPAAQLDTGLQVGIPGHVDLIDTRMKTIDLIGTLPDGTTNCRVNGQDVFLIGDRFAAPETELTDEGTLEFVWTDANGDTISQTIRPTFRSEDLTSNLDAITMPQGTIVPKPGIDPKILQRLHSGSLVGPDTNQPEIPTVHAVVQFREPTSTSAARKVFPGMKYLERTSKSSWIASVSEADLAQLQGSDLVRSVFLPVEQNKIRLNLMRIAAADSGDNPVEVKIRFHKDVAQAQAVAILQQAEAKFDPAGRGMLNDWEVAVAPEKLLELASLDSVRHIDEPEPERTRENNRSRANARVDALQRTPFNLTGTGVNGGIWDGGLVDLDHPDFNGRLTAMEAAAEDDHATHVAGTMGGDGSADPNQPGRLRGMAPGMRIFSRDFLGNTPEEHEGAIDDRSIDLSQNSWGYSSAVTNRHGLYAETTQKYDAVVRGFYDRRIPVVFSAGNEQRHGPFGTVNAPGGTGKNIISVGAINNDDSSMTSFSSWGPTDDGRLKPDLVAPGGTSGNATGIVSAIPRAVATPSQLDRQNNAPGPSIGPGDGIDNFFFPYSDSAAGDGELEPRNQVPASADIWEGTSMAAPVVSGVIALMLEEYRMTLASTPHTDLRPLPSTFHAILTNSAEDLTTDPRTGSAVDFSGPDYIYGFGQLNATRAVLMVRNRDFIEDDISEDQEIDTHTVDLPEGLTEWKVNLAWNDAPGVGDSINSPSSQPKLINDLDLVLIAPDGTRHYPWILDPSNPDTPATRAVRAAGDPESDADNDHLNNCVQVAVDSPEAGEWTIRVSASALPDDIQPQRYSLAFPSNFRDLMIRDVALDRGNAGSPAPWWNSPDIRVAAQNNQKSIKVRVSNRGYLPVTNASLAVYCVPASPGVPEFAIAGANVAEPWKKAGEAPIPAVNGGANREIDIEWPAEFAEDPDGMCLVAVIDCEDDRTEFGDQSNLGLLAQEHNNIAYRNVLPLTASMSTDIEPSTEFDATQLPIAFSITAQNSVAAAATGNSASQAPLTVQARGVVTPNLDARRVEVDFSEFRQLHESGQKPVLQVLQKRNGRVTGGLSVIYPSHNR